MTPEERKAKGETMVERGTFEVQVSYRGDRLWWAMVFALLALAFGLQVQLSRRLSDLEERMEEKP
jgi:hypothetical protein